MDGRTGQVSGAVPDPLPDRLTTADRFTGPYDDVADWWSTSPSAPRPRGPLRR